MSADNYIIVLETPTDSGYEYRVKHVLGRYWEGQIGHPRDGEWSNEKQRYVGVTQTYQNLQQVIQDEFKECDVYTDKGEALLAAHELEAATWFVEYGVSIESFPWKFGSIV